MFPLPAVLSSRALPYIGAVLLTVAILGGTYAAGRNAERSKWKARDAEIARQVAVAKADDLKRVQTLTDELEELRARPERVRVVTKEVIRRVIQDRECPSLPADFRRLWDASGGDPASSAAAPVADQPATPVAAPGVD